MKHSLHTAGRKLFLLIFSIPLLFTWSCETIDTLTGGAATVAKLEGDWTCVEQSELLKASESTFAVTLSPDANDQSGIIIDNFYNLQESATASVSAMTFTIPQQNIAGGFSASGSGTISSNYEKITLSYAVDDGSGKLDHCTAVYTKN